MILRIMVLVAGIPKLYWYGSEGDYNIMVMDFLGTNLEDLKKECGGKLSMITLCYVAEQMVHTPINLDSGR